MLIIGAKGHAKEIIDVLDNFDQVSYAFFDNINKDIENQLFGKIVIKDFLTAKSYLEKNNTFILAVGGPKNRYLLYNCFKTEYNAIPFSVISKTATVSKYTKLGLGLNIMSFAFISNSVTIGNGCLINAYAKIHHNTTIGEFTEISPNATVLGNCSIGNYSFIGASATILPKITIGDNVIVAAGSVVTKNVPNNCMVAGIPAVVKKKLNPIKL
jgi:sugar O-acyltransferase (sialic acid O-acetyltransferase NeuD family)